MKFQYNIHKLCFHFVDFLLKKVTVRLQLLVADTMSVVLIFTALVDQSAAEQFAQ